MTDIRFPAAWLRSFAGLLALAGALVLSGCGGGGGAPNNQFNPFTILNAAGGAAIDVYSGLPTTINVSGGVAPYRASSSNPTVLPISDSSQNSPLTLTANNVAADTTVQLSVQDSMGKTAVASVRIHPAPLLNFLTLKADNFSAGCPNDRIGTSTPTDESGSTWICAGQTGTVGVRLLNTGTNNPVAGRQVRFEVVQGHFRFFTNGPGQPDSFALSYTVPADQDGNAVARVKADASAPQEIVIIQATDVATGYFVRGVFVINSPASNTPQIYPDSVEITGPDSSRCSTGWVTSFYVYGGHPPYTINNPFPQALSISPSSVTVAGGGFNVTTNGSCVDPANIIVADANGQIATAELSNVPGTGTPTTPNPISVQPTPISPLGCGASTTVFATGGGTATTPATTFNVNSSNPAILSALPATASPGAPITLNRLNAGTVDGSQPAGSNVNVTLFVSDTRQVLSVIVPVRNTCP